MPTVPVRSHARDVYLAVPVPRLPISVCAMWRYWLAFLSIARPAVQRRAGPLTVARIFRGPNGRRRRPRWLPRIPTALVE